MELVLLGLFLNVYLIVTPMVEKLYQNYFLLDLLQLVNYFKVVCKVAIYVVIAN